LKVFGDEFFVEDRNAILRFDEGYDIKHPHRVDDPVFYERIVII